MICYKDARLLSFIGGAALAIIAGKIVKCPKTREICVKGLAKGMQLQQDAQVCLQNMREEAQDLCAEAREQVVVNENDGCCGEKKTACEEKA